MSNAEVNRARGVSIRAGNIAQQRGLISIDEEGSVKDRDGYVVVAAPEALGAHDHGPQDTQEAETGKWRHQSTRQDA